MDAEGLFEAAGRVLRRGALFGEIDRVASCGATLSVFPHHMGSSEIEKEVTRRAAEIGFSVASEYTGPVVHDDIVKGHVATFRRRGRHR